MDFTKQELRPLIYKERKDIDCFNITEPDSIDSKMLQRIESSVLVTFDGADKYILDIFNNAHYITALILMEKHPVHFLKKYINIAEHTSSSYYDIYQNNTYHIYFSAIIMSMVLNYLSLFDNKYLNENNIFKQQLFNHFHRLNNYANFNEQVAIHSLFFDNILVKINNYHLDKSDFDPRVIDAQAISEANTILYQNNLDWRKLTEDYNHTIIGELLALCQNGESKSILAETIRREASSFKDENTVNFLDTLDLQQVLPPKEVVKTTDLALIQHTCLKLIDENEILKNNQKDIEESVLSNQRIKELEDELAEFKSRQQNRTGLNPFQAAHFTLKLAQELGITATNECLANGFSKIFGFGAQSLRQKMGTYITDESEKMIFDIMYEISPLHANRMWPKFAKSNNLELESVSS